MIAVVAVLVAVLGAFIAVVAVDLTGGSSGSPPSGTEEFEISGRDHVEEAVSYEQSPPAGGNHNPVWQNAGFYEEPVRNENAVHTLEHGAVWITYASDLPQAGKDRIRDVVGGQDCVLASPFPGLDAPVVASAWGKQLRFDGADDPDLEGFVRSFQRGPQTPEPGAACTGGTADPA